MSAITDKKQKLLEKLEALKKLQKDVASRVKKLNSVEKEKSERRVLKIKRAASYKLGWVLMDSLPAAVIAEHVGMLSEKDRRFIGRELETIRASGDKALLKLDCPAAVQGAELDRQRQAEAGRQMAAKAAKTRKTGGRDGAEGGKTP